ncbi:MAG: AAA family ATPase [Desulfatirhabdiaceae bacterium]
MRNHARYHWQIRYLPPRRYPFQDPNDQLFCTHVQEDIAYGPTNLGLDADEVNGRVAAAMDLMEVSHLANRPIHRLSHGEMRRVGLAGVIAMQPPLILLDEPTASLDPASTQHLIRLIRHLNSHHGYTLIMVTHDINVASMIATRVIILDQGTIVADGTPRAILTDRSLLERSRLEPPLLTRLFQELDQGIPNSAPIPLTIDEALERLADMKKNRSSPDEETYCS